MKTTFTFFTAALLFCLPVLSQTGVGINTTNLSEGSALQIDSNKGSLVMPRMTTEEMNNIATPLDGAMIYNTTENNWFTRINGVWTRFSYNDTPSIILNRNGGDLQMQSDPPLLLPLNSNNLLFTDSNYYQVDFNEEVPRDGTVKILRDGTYLVTAGLSTTNLPADPKKYKVLVYVNGLLQSYLTSGNVDLASNDYWGTSGNSILILQQNDLVEVKYVLDGTGTIQAKFVNMGISKL